MSFNKTGLSLLSSVAALFLMALPACVNEEYDLNKGIDTTIDIEGNISAPVGSTEKIMIGDLFEIEEGSILQADPQTGDWHIYVESDTPVSETIEIKPVTLNAANMVADNGISLTVSMRNIIHNDMIGSDTPISSVYIENFSPFDDGATGDVIEAVLDEDMGGISDVVKAIGKLKLDTPVTLELTITAGSVTVNGGFSLVFPECFKVALAEQYDFCYTDDGHTLMFTRDFIVRHDAPVKVDLMLEEIDIEALQKLTGGTQGLVDGRFVFNQEIALENFSFDIKGSDFGQTVSDVPEEVTVRMGIQVEDVTLKAATVVLSPDFQIEPQSIEIGEMPEFLTGAGTVLDLFNPAVKFTVVNSSPVSASISAMLRGYDADGMPEGELGIGGAASPITISTGVTDVYLSTRGVSLPEPPEIQQVGYNEPLNIVLPGLSEFIGSLPYTIKIEDINITMPDDEYITVQYPEDGSSIIYRFEAGYSLDVPLAFGDRLNLEYSYDITGLNGTFTKDPDADGGDMAVHLSEAVVNMTFISTIPVGLTIVASPIDVDGNVITESGLEVELVSVDGSPVTIEPGKDGSESSRQAMIRLRAEEGALDRLDGFRLGITGTAGSSAGVVLNSAHYMQIADISVTINGGVEM